LKFTSILQESRTSFNKNKSTDKPTSFVKLPLLIPEKSHKEVMEISKFFKQETKLIEKKETRKSYAQALLSKISKILKIKKTFLELLADKIDNIHKIINGDNKLKPKLNMITKGLSKKQVIIPINNDSKML